MLKCLPTRPRRFATEAETKAFSIETEAKTKTFSLEAEARPKHLKIQPRRDRAETLLRLETASRPRRQGRGHVPGMLSANFKPKRTAAASRGFLATARLSCEKNEQTILKVCIILYPIVTIHYLNDLFCSLARTDI